MIENVGPATQAEVEALDKARRAAEAAQAKLAKLEAEEALRRDAVAVKRAERKAEYDADFHARWRDVANDIASSDREDRKRATEYDPKTMGFLESLISFAAGRGKRVAVMDHARRAESTLGIGSAQSTVPDERAYQLDVLGFITQIVEQEAERRTAEFADALEAERDKYINGDA